jgi:hypothetical protein
MIHAMWIGESSNLEYVSHHPITGDRTDPSETGLSVALCSSFFMRGLGNKSLRDERMTVARTGVGRDDGIFVTTARLRVQD